MYKRFFSTGLFCLLATAVTAHAPVNPRILPGTVSATEAIVFWEFPEDYASISRYDLQVNGRCVGSTEHNSFRIENLTPETTYRIRVSAVDAAGRKSVAAPVILRTNPAPEIFNVRDFGISGRRATAGLSIRGLFNGPSMPVRPTEKSMFRPEII